MKLQKLQINNRVNLFFDHTGYRFQHSIINKNPEKLDSWEKFKFEARLYPEAKQIFYNYADRLPDRFKNGNVYQNLAFDYWTNN